MVFYGHATFCSLNCEPRLNKLEINSEPCLRNGQTFYNEKEDEYIKGDGQLLIIDHFRFVSYANEDGDDE